MSSMHTSQGVDMNDEINLNLYSQLILFKNDCSRSEISWAGPEYRLRSTLSSLAHKLDLEYEYSLSTRIARISRVARQDMLMNPENDPFSLRSLDHSQNDGGFSLGFNAPTSKVQGPLDPKQPVSCFLVDDLTTQDPSVESSMIPGWSSSDYLDTASPHRLGRENSELIIGGASPSVAMEDQSLSSRENESSAQIFPGTQWRQTNQFQGLEFLATEQAESSLQHEATLDYSYSARVSSAGSDVSSESNILDPTGLSFSGTFPLSPTGMSEGSQVGVSTPPDEDLNDLISIAGGTSDTNTQSSRRGRFGCAYPGCHVSFAKRQHLVVHVRQPIGERPFVCHCTQRFRRFETLQLHAQTIHGNVETRPRTTVPTASRPQRPVSSGIKSPLTPGALKRGGLLIDSASREEGPTVQSFPWSERSLNTTTMTSRTDPAFNLRYSGQSTIAESMGSFAHSTSQPSSPVITDYGPYRGERNIPMICTNCRTQVTPLWRSDPEGRLLCNACGLFLKLHGSMRPLSLNTDVLKKRNRGSRSEFSPTTGFSNPNSRPIRRNNQERFGSTTPGSAPQNIAGRSNSVSNSQRDRLGGKLAAYFRRRSSGHGNEAGSEYQEIVFDSRSAHSGSQASNASEASTASAASAASGRRGPLDSFTKAAMKAVKLVGACWRCKFLRKSCNTESPCALCPKGSSRSKSNWEAVGCKRGDLKTQMASVKLCFHPGIFNWQGADYECGPQDIHDLNLVNDFLVQNLVRREQELESLAIVASESQNQEPGITAFTSCHLLPDNFLPLGLPISVYLHLRSPNLCSPALAPLNGCILAIAWEIHDGPFAFALPENGLLGIIKLLQFSAIYQSTFEKDQLIAQSLICFRSCLEALRTKEFSDLGRTSHKACSDQSCKIQCIETLQLSLTLYLDELSRVFFEKENLRDKSKVDWYISTFYSFCIQALVRRALKKLSTLHNCSDGVYSTFASLFNCFVGSALAASEKYLHLAVQLFIASCGTYDPLAIDYSEYSKESPSEFQKDLNSLKQAVGDPIQSSSKYLRKIFEIEEVGPPVAEPTPWPGPAISLLGLSDPIGISGSSSGPQEWDWLTMSL